ncbi:MAG: M42 family metallopeptidase [Erysipelothrix sp.]|nr:M42 family metallopeptidase [Erysipelothrix sp.]
MFNIDKDFTLKVAKDILTIHSPTGYTKDGIERIEQYLLDLGYDSKKTPKGNLIIEIPGLDNDYTVGLSAHIDTLGLMVRSIDSEGGLNFTVLGGPILNTYDGEYCTVITRDNKRYRGTVLSKSPSVHVYEDSKSRKRDENNMYVRLDERVQNKEDVVKLGISNGDIIAIDQKVELTKSGFIKSRFLDDKISVALIIGFLKMLKDNNVKPKNKLKIMFSVYEEVGHGMAWIPADIKELLSVDMGSIGLDLECSEFDVSICAKDSSGPYDYEMVSKLIELSKENKLQYAVDIYPMYGSDTSAALRGGNNIKGALIGPGVHASHGMERTHYEAVENTMKLLYLYLVK